MILSDWLEQCSWFFQQEPSVVLLQKFQFVKHPRHPVQQIFTRTLNHVPILRAEILES